MRKLLHLVAFAALVAALPVRASVPSSSSSASYVCNGTTTAYAVPFRFLATGDLVVSRAVTGSSSSVALALTTDYTVTGAGSPSGGNVTLVAGSRCAAGYTLTIKRKVALTQGSSFKTSGLTSGGVEAGLDKVTMGLQQLDRDKANNLTGGCATGQVLTTLDGANLACVDDQVGSAVVSDTGFGTGGATYYAKSTGADANDCLSWTTACRTILAAYDKLTTTGGTIFIGDQTEVGGEVTGQGLWLVGPASDNYNDGDRLPGWRKLKPFKLIGASGIVGGQFAPPGQARIVPTGGTWTSVPIWIFGGSSGNWFENIAVTGGTPSTAYIGSHRPAGTPISDDTGGGVTANVWFKNSLLGPPAVGPTVYFGWTFWVWFDQSVLLAQSGATLNTKQRAVAAAEPPTGGYAGLIHFTDCRISGGNLWHVGKSGFAGGYQLNRVTFENPIGDCGISERTWPSGTLFGGAHVLRDVEFADLSLPGGAVCAEDSTVSLRATLDHVTINGSPQGALGTSSDVTANKLAQRYFVKLDAASAYHSMLRPMTRDSTAGIAGGILWGQHDGAARLSAPHAARYLNQASELAGGTASPAPDGSNRAKRYGAVYQVVASLSGITPSVGDHFIFAVWSRELYAGVTSGGGHRFSGSTTNFDTNLGVSGATWGGPPALAVSVGNWQIVKYLARVTSVGAGTKSLSVGMESLGATPDFAAYQPTLLYLPASEVNENEAAEIFTHIVPGPVGAPVGDVALARGQRISLWDTTSSTWNTQPIALRGTATTDVASIAAQACADVAVTVTGATTGAECVAGEPSSLNAGLTSSCRVSATNTAQVRLCNPTSSPIDPPSLTYSARVFVP